MLVILLPTAISHYDGRFISPLKSMKLPIWQTGSKSNNGYTDKAVGLIPKERPINSAESINQSDAFTTQLN
ncbi:MAG: hypothetical protein R2784_06545 [Saprospiraceae bacterium]